MNTTEQTARLERAKMLANLIANGNFGEAATEIRGKGASAAGTDTLPEGIARYFIDQKIRDINFLIAVVEEVVMGYLSKEVISDMASIGYKVEKVALYKAVKGCQSYWKAVSAHKLGYKYQINNKIICPCCKRMRGKTFSLSEAKVGKTLPPFSDDCRACVDIAFQD